MGLWVGDNSGVYEDIDWEELPAQDDVLQKNRILQALVPGGSESLLDVGCGSGLFINDLPADWRVMGLDRSVRALSHVTREKVESAVTVLPFRDSEFDTVVCSEVLEHLTTEDLKLAVAEITRVAAQAVIITVPNSENLWASAMRCRSCGTQFNTYGHIQSFERHDITGLMVGWVESAYCECGRLSPQTPRLMAWGRARFGNDSVPAPGAECPVCGSFNARIKEPTLWDRAYGRAVRHAEQAGHLKPYWMALLFEREQVPGSD